jgi:membrane protein YdbS with pleckstrin-like domain
MSKSSHLKSFIKNPENTSYKGKDNDENIVFLIRQSSWATAGWILSTIFLAVVILFVFPYLSKINYNGKRILEDGFILLLVIFLYITLFGRAFHRFLDWYFEVFLITTKKIVDIDKGAVSISETPLENVQDVTSKIQSVFGQMLNIGSIHIQTAAEKGEFEFEMVDDPSTVRDTLSDMVAEVKGRKNGK